MDIIDTPVSETREELLLLLSWWSCYLKTKTNYFPKHSIRSSAQVAKACLLTSYAHKGTNK